MFLAKYLSASFPNNELSNLCFKMVRQVLDIDACFADHPPDSSGAAPRYSHGSHRNSELLYNNKRCHFSILNHIPDSCTSNEQYPSLCAMQHVLSGLQCFKAWQFHRPIYFTQEDCLLVCPYVLLFCNKLLQDAPSHFLTSLRTESLQVDLSRYNLPNYMGIVTFKTAYYSFYLPVACGLVLANRADEATLKLAQGICLQMGQYFQVHTNFLCAQDCCTGGPLLWSLHLPICLQSIPLS